MRTAGNGGVGAIFLAGALLIACQQTVAAAECSGHSDEPLVSLLSPPPCETCEETKAELGELEALQRARTPQQEEHAVRDVERTLPRFLQGAGIAFEAEALHSCEIFFFKRAREGKAAVAAAKFAFCRPRPLSIPGNTLRPLDEPKPSDSHDNYSYPSGHATYGATVGFLLAEMMPEKRAAIYARIDDYAHSRMVAGVHFRSDVVAGKLYGAAIAEALFAKPGFEAEFQEAKACVRHAVGLQ
ncbi:MAG: phosphatase PAP2 family protein [Rhodomicrobium sp.]